jgi:hypothetical protein
MGSTDRDVELTPAEVIVGTAYTILHMLPADPDKAAPLLAMVGDALKARKPQLIEGWSGEASYVLSHLRKRDAATAARILAVAAGIVETVRPHFAALARSA